MSEIHEWMGRPITELTRDELLQVIDWCAKEIKDLRNDRSKWQSAADPVKYLQRGER